jgi:hypothetical protein
MSTVVIACQVSGTADAEDRLAMDLAIANENARRTQLGRPLLSVLPGDRRASYEATLTPLLLAKHQAAIERSVKKEADDAAFKALRKAWSQATPAQRTAARAQLP